MPSDELFNTASHSFTEMAFMWRLLCITLQQFRANIRGYNMCTVRYMNPIEAVRGFRAGGLMSQVCSM